MRAVFAPGSATRLSPGVGGSLRRFTGPLSFERRARRSSPPHAIRIRAAPRLELPPVTDVPAKARHIWRISDAHARFIRARRRTAFEKLDEPFEVDARPVTDTSTGSAPVVDVEQTNRAPLRSSFHSAQRRGSDELQHSRRVRRDLPTDARAIGELETVATNSRDLTRLGESFDHPSRTEHAPEPDDQR